MSELKGACIFGQSGGPTSVINASAYGVIATALKNPNITRVLGAEHGIKGVLNDRLFDMGQEDPAELELLKYTPSSALGSCRYKMADPDVDDTDYKRILEIFKKYDVRYFFYNGCFFGDHGGRPRFPVWRQQAGGRHRPQRRNSDGVFHSRCPAGRL